MRILTNRRDTPTLTLQHSTLLAGLPAETVQVIEERCRWLACFRGDMVLGADDPLDGIYFIVQGRVCIRHQENAAIKRTTSFGPGDAFGELSAIDGGGRAAEVEAEDDAVVAVCPRTAFLSALEEHPALALRLIRKLAGIIRAADSRMAARKPLGGAQRVYAELLRIAVPDPADPQRLEVSPAPLHKDLAQRVDTTPDVVARALAQAMRAELLARQGSRLVINDVTRLELLIQEPAAEAATAEAAGG